MVASNHIATLGLFCEDTSTSIVKLGLLCPDVPGGGSLPPAIQENYFNQTPHNHNKRAPVNPFLQQALQEDEEMLVLFHSFIEIIKCH